MKIRAAAAWTYKKYLTTFIARSNALDLMTEERRLTLQQQQYELQRSKALGEFDVDLEEDEDEQREKF